MKPKRDDYWTVDPEKIKDHNGQIWKDVQPKGFIFLSPPQMASHRKEKIYSYNYEDSHPDYKKIL